MVAGRNLNDRERAFVREYLVDLNGAAAARRAGYSPKSARGIAYGLLNRPRVSAAIDAAIADRQRRLEISADRVLGELARLGFANILDYFAQAPDGTVRVDLDRVSRDRAAAIVDFSVEEGVAGAGAAGRGTRKVKIKLADKSRNLELIGRHLGLFTSKPEAKDAAGEGAPVELSDLELGQRILALLVRGKPNGSDTAADR